MRCKYGHLSEPWERVKKLHKHRFRLEMLEQRLFYTTGNRIAYADPKSLLPGTRSRSFHVFSIDPPYIVAMFKVESAVKCRLKLIYICERDLSALFRDHI